MASLYRFKIGCERFAALLAIHVALGSGSTVEGPAAASLVRRDAPRRTRLSIHSAAVAIGASGKVAEQSTAERFVGMSADDYARDWRLLWQWERPAGVQVEAASIMQMETVEGSTRKASHSSMHASPSGLPWAAGTPPNWLLRSDGLIVDGRTDEQKKTGGGKLLVSVVNMDAGNTWETSSSKRPRWLRVMLAANKAHAVKHGHAFVLRWQPTQPALTDWQLNFCHRDNISSSDECSKHYERENINWEKHLMIADYLNSTQAFSHVLMLDADAMFMRHDLDTMQRMADILEDKKAELFSASEDWLKYGENRLNGGVLLAKNSQFNRDLFNDLWECHRGMRVHRTRTLGDSVIECSSNEMVALNDWRERPGMKQKMHLASGRYWNRGGEVLFSQNPTFSDKRMYELGLKDPDMEIIHFMGGAKGGAGDVICSSGLNLTLEGPAGYGCAP
eukprot:TRINITY_DN101676_c0_g1_i1.p1 TRINITY_DN101676_c0_g1~~TRINITY_DN101676_c0_g1_i1.p1  ORF type:complete len:471 (-),score=89.58 TRINITY_DN101676_c0_g1_i1:48-1391(-)